MKNYYLAGAFALLLFSCTKETLNEENAALVPKSEIIFNRETGDTSCIPASVTVALLAGQTINAGNVTVTNDGINLTVAYNAQNGWSVSGIHLYVGPYADAPQNNGGNPVPGKFPYKEVFNPYVSGYVKQIPLSTLPDCFIIAAHAVVRKNGGSETAWSEGLGFPGNNWGMYFNYCKCQ
jgi:hypothetical protein